MGPFTQVFGQVNERFMLELHEIIRVSYTLRAQLFLFCFVIDVGRRSAKTYEKSSVLSIFGSLGPFPQVFWQVKECLILKMDEMIRMWYVIACPMVFSLLSNRGRQGGVLKLLKNHLFMYFLAFGSFFSKFLGSLRLGLYYLLILLILCL